MAKGGKNIATKTEIENLSSTSDTGSVKLVKQTRIV